MEKQEKSTKKKSWVKPAIYLLLGVAVGSLGYAKRKEIKVLGSKLITAGKNRFSKKSIDVSAAPTSSVESIKKFDGFKKNEPSYKERFNKN